MAKQKRRNQGTPLAVVKPPKKIGDMTDAERRKFADEIFDGINRTRKPAS